jgi:putative PIN family toxin of toxin-antitoxin system
VIRAVIDTNVLVSALISPSGNEALLLLAIGDGYLTPYFSPEICTEYAGVLSRPKFGFASDEISALMTLLQNHGELILAPAISGASPDPYDDKFIACAVVSQADYLVTGNKRDFPSDRLAPTAVVNAGELLQHILDTLP